MNKPPLGHYKQLLTNLPDIRIARTDVPMTGVTRVDNTEVLRQLDASNDPFATYYSENIRSGAFVVIIETPNPNKVYSPGELFFRS